MNDISTMQTASSGSTREAYPHMTTVAVTATGGGLMGNQGDGCWPDIVSRFQLVILAGRRSKQLYNGALPRIPADPLKRRNTSIALEELRRGLVPFAGQNGNASHVSPIAIDTSEPDPSNARY